MKAVIKFFKDAFEAYVKAMSANVVEFDGTIYPMLDYFE